MLRSAWIGVGVFVAILLTGVGLDNGLGPAGWTAGTASQGRGFRVVRASRIAAVGAGEADHAKRVTSFALRYGIQSRLSRLIYDTARAERLNPELAFGLVHVESRFDPRAVGASGAIGLTQIRPATARELAPRVSASDLYAPSVNLRLGFRYLHTMLERFDQDVMLALSAYNRGPTHVAADLARGVHPRATYARKVLRNVEPGATPTL